MRFKQKLCHLIVLITASLPLMSNASQLIRLECKGIRTYTDKLTGKTEISSHSFSIELDEAKRKARFQGFMLWPYRSSYDCEFSNDAILCAVEEKNTLRDKVISDLKVSGTQAFFTVFTINRLMGVATEHGLSMQNTTVLKEDVSFVGRYDCNVLKKKF